VDWEEILEMREKRIKNDKNTNIAVLKSKVKSFVKIRDWEIYHTPRNLSESICIEAAELLQIFQWGREDITEHSSFPEASERIAEELADIIIYCVSMANTIGIDITSAVLTKIKTNEDKYPVQIWKGKSHLKNREY